MAWIESHQSLLTHRKTARLARRLGISKVTAIGHLHALWWWCMDNAQDGSLSRIDVEDIADGSCWDGDPSGFIEALVFAGFVDEESDGRRAVHEWPEYAGKLIEKRTSDAARKRAARLGIAVQRTSRGHPEDGAGTVPNPTVPNPTQPDHERRPVAATPVAASAAVASEETTVSKVKTAPKPNKFADVIDALKAVDIEVTTTKADAGAVKDCSAPAALIAEAYGAAYRGDWPPGESWLRNNLNLQAVCKRIDGFKAYKEGNGNAQARTGRAGQPDRQRPGGPGGAGNPELAEYQRREEQRGLAALAEARRRRAGDSVLDS